MLNVLVTGGAGFIGSHLVKTLIREGFQVRVLDNFSTGSMDNLEGVKHRMELVDGDIRNPRVVKQAVSGVEVIFHQAASPSVQRSMKNPMATVEINAGGTLNLLEAARQCGVRRLVYASSSSVYGDHPDPLRREAMLPQPMSPYALSKWIGEKYCALYSQLFHVETVALRYFNVFGPAQDPASPYAAVVPRFIAAIIANRKPVIYGDGEQSRDFTFVDNVVQANLLASRVKGISGRVFNVGAGQSTTVRALAETVAGLLDAEAVVPSYEPARSGDVRHSQADITLAAEHLGYAPTVSIEEGLRRTIAWTQSVSLSHVGCP